MTDLRHKTAPEIITFDDIIVNVTRSARRKTLSLEVDTHGVKVRAPERMRWKTIEQFVHSKRTWIARHYANRPAAPSPIELHNGAILKLLDDDFYLQVVTQKRGSIELSKDTITLPIVASKRPLQSSIKDKLVKWYKQQALICLRDKVAFFAEEMNIDLAKNMNVKVRAYKRRWGSCDHKGDLSFNWRIIMAPEEVLDYVAVHEIAHLKEFNHSKRFWNIVNKQCPSWQKQRDWLNNNGASLYRF